MAVESTILEIQVSQFGNSTIHEQIEMKKWMGVSTAGASLGVYDGFWHSILARKLGKFQNVYMLSKRSGRG